MKKINFESIFVSLLLGLGILTASVFLTVLTARNKLDKLIPGVKFENLQAVKDNFLVPENDNLNILILSMKNPSLTDSLNYLFYINDNDQPVREIAFSGENVGDPSDIRFQFEPISDSSGKKYKVGIKTNDSEESEIKVAVDEGNRIAYSSYYRSKNIKGRFVDTLNQIFVKKVISNLFFFGIWSLFLGLLIIFYLKLSSEKSSDLS